MDTGKKGFTLAEVTMLCFAGTTLLALLTVSAVNSRETASTIGCINNMKNLMEAVELYQSDYKTTPGNIADLYPMYIGNGKNFKCPADRTAESNSYEFFYIGRFMDADDPDKILLSCPRHHKNTTTVAAYLSYAVDTGKNLPVAWNGAPAEYGEVYPAGEMTFADGTTVSVRSGSAGLHSSFIDNSQKIHTTIYTTDGNAGSLLINHGSDSKFAVITPAVIAELKNTELEVVNTADAGEQGSNIIVNNGQAVIEDRRFDAVGTTVTQTLKMTPVSVAVMEESAPSEPLKKRVPRRPRKTR